MIATGDLRKGIAIEFDGNLYRIEDFQHVKMGPGQRLRQAQAAEHSQGRYYGANVSGRGAFSTRHVG